VGRRHPEVWSPLPEFARPLPSPHRRRFLFVLGFLIYFGALWYAWESVLVYPLKVFVVFLHEVSHGIAAVFTGGSIQQITLSPRLGGSCYCPGGNAFVTLSAGYLGSLGWGAAILEAIKLSGSKVAWVVRLLGAGVVLSTLLFGRGAFGFAFGILFGIGLILAARHLSTTVNRIILTALGLTSCLYAVLDIKSDVLDRPELQSDARMLAELTGVPTLAWGILWITVAASVSAVLLLRAYRSA